MRQDQRVALPNEGQTRLIAVVVFVSWMLPVAADDGPAIPPDLEPWVPWVLHDAGDAGCAHAPGEETTRQCAWPGALELTVSAGEIRLRQRWTLLAESDVTLPGQATLWPLDVRANEEPVVVTAQRSEPVVRLPAGEHRLSARLPFTATPRFVQLPRRGALVRLRRGGALVTAPDIDADGRLWLARRTDDSVADMPASVSIELYSHLADGVPLQLLQRLELDVTGRPREQLLDGLVPDGFVPLALAAALPAQLDAEGVLRLQLRPGRHAVELRLRASAPLDVIERADLAAPLPPVGLLSFSADPSLRTVSLEGLAPVDPRQTRLPAAWRELPTFRFGTGEALRLVERQRGDTGQRGDELAVQRTAWLDFDGEGFTLRDQLGGRLGSAWRLNATPAFDLGRVSVNGEPRLVTQSDDTRARGVEVARGPLNAVAEGRMAPASDGPWRRLDAVGWDNDAQSLQTTLMLPPGWRLITATGADRVVGAWLTRWSLLDLFVVLIGAVAAGKLFGWRTGALALVVLGLSYHEPGAPRWVWLHLLAATALLAVLPAGRLRSLSKVYRLGALLAVLAVAVPFAATALSNAAFPQLENPGNFGGRVFNMFTPTEGMVAAPAAEQAVVAADEMEASTLRSAPAPASKAYGSGASNFGRASSGRYDPSAQLQTGPGLPAWSWRRATLSWQGPVTAGEEVRLLLLSPWQTGAVRVVTVLLLGLLLWRGLRGGKRAQPAAEVATNTPAPGSGAAGVAAAAALLGGYLLMGGSHSAQADQVPSPELLEELRSRLLAPPECAPACAANPRLRLSVSEAELRLALEVHTRTRMSVPLPGVSREWQPTRISISGSDDARVSRERDGSASLLLPAGVHDVLIEGPLPDVTSLPLPLPLRPAHVTIDAAPGIEVRGLRADGQVGGQLIVERAPAESDAASPGRTAAALPPFMLVERYLQLGLDWRVTTRVRRLSDASLAVALRVPLLDGESVLSDRVEVRDGHALINLPPGADAVEWTATLPLADVLQLHAAAANTFVERWQVDVAPVWHATRVDGIAPDFTDDAGRTVRWRPWPGEQVDLRITRPSAAPGPTLTTRSSVLTATPGARATVVTLELVLLGSQGGEHALHLPAEASLERVSVDGVELPARREGRRVIVPLAPGERTVVVRWREPRGADVWRYETPAVDLGLPSVNAHLKLTVPASRWLLWTDGPLLGPAVRFWGLVAVLLVLSPILARSKLTPLGTVSWFLLGIGLTQVPPIAALVVAVWLFALGARGRSDSQAGPAWRFNIVQIAIVFLTLAALAIVAQAIAAGLLGSPQMQVGGNGSYAGNLRWFADRGPSELPVGVAYSVPTLVYRLLMLAWALWVAAGLVRWLAWGWRQFSHGGHWRRLRFPTLRKPVAPNPPKPGAQATAAVIDE